MRLVVGLDVSKGKSDGQAFKEKNKPLGRSFQFEHTKTGLAELQVQLQWGEKESGNRPIVILEATSHYHKPVVAFLRDLGYETILVNPLTSQRAKKTHLRKVKTDASDAYHLGDLYYREDFRNYKEKNNQLIELQFLTRQHDDITKMYVQLKLKFHAILDQVFPAYSGVFGNLFSKSSLLILQESPPQL